MLLPKDGQNEQGRGQCCVFNEGTLHFYRIRAWIMRKRHKNLFLLSLQNYYVSQLSSESCLNQMPKWKELLRRPVHTLSMLTILLQNYLSTCLTFVVKVTWLEFPLKHNNI